MTNIASIKDKFVMPILPLFSDHFTPILSSLSPDCIIRMVNYNSSILKGDKQK